MMGGKEESKGELLDKRQESTKHRQTHSTQQFPLTAYTEVAPAHHNTCRYNQTSLIFFVIESNLGDFNLSLTTSVWDGVSQFALLRHTLSCAHSVQQSHLGAAPLQTLSFPLHFPCSETLKQQLPDPSRDNFQYFAIE